MSSKLHQVSTTNYIIYFTIVHRCRYTIDSIFWRRGKVHFAMSCPSEVILRDRHYIEQARSRASLDHSHSTAVSFVTFCDLL